MFNKFIDLFKHKEIRNRILFTLAMFFIYRLGAALSVPSVDNELLMQGMADNGILGMMNLLGGGALQQFSIFAMGIGPYITASIIIQLMSMDVIPYLTDLARSGGAEGKKKIDRITRYFAVILAFFQAYTMTYAFDISYGILINNDISTFLYVATILTAGTMFLLWMADRISSHGVGNGISMIIFAGIVANYPSNFSSAYSTLVSGGADASATFNGMLAFAGYVIINLAIIALVIFMNNAVRKIPIQYTTSSLAQTKKNINYLPLKINSASVIPIIFASAIMTAPLTVLSFFPQTDFTITLSKILDIGQPVGLGIYVVLVILFTFFYTSLQVDPEKIAENLGKSGSYIPGIRPGIETQEYINRVLKRITVLGALFIAFIGALPYLIPMFTSLPSSFGLGGTGIIIVVGVAQETIKDLVGQLTQKNYKGFKRTF